MNQKLPILVSFVGDIFKNDSSLFIFLPLCFCVR